MSLVVLTVAINVSHYEVQNYYCQTEQVIRSWSENQNSKVLVVDQNLKTKIVDPKTLNCDFARHHPLAEKINNTPMPGIASGPGNGYYLSIDLCPSSKPHFNPELWSLLEKRTPVAISITKKWALQHPKDWQKILTIQRINHNITWLNHTSHHQLITKEDYNPFLVPDLLENEEWLISQGETPSVFFRLPGLLYVSQTKMFTKAVQLIPVGAGAWLSKGQKPQLGDIILIHGNQNDPKGISLLEKLIKNNPEIKWLDWTNLLSP